MLALPWDGGCSDSPFRIPAAAPCESDPASRVMWLWRGPAPSARGGSGEQTALSRRPTNLPRIKQGLDADLSLLLFHASPNLVLLYAVRRRHNEAESKITWSASASLPLTRTLCKLEGASVLPPASLINSLVLINISTRVASATLCSVQRGEELCPGS